MIGSSRPLPVPSMAYALTCSSFRSPPVVFLTTLRRIRVLKLKVLYLVAFIEAVIALIISLDLCHIVLNSSFCLVLSLMAWELMQEVDWPRVLSISGT